MRCYPSSLAVRCCPVIDACQMSLTVEVVPGIDPQSGKKRWMLNVAKLKASDTIVALAAGVAEGVVQRTVCE